LLQILRLARYFLDPISGGAEISPPNRFLSMDIQDFKVALKPRLSFKPLIPQKTCRLLDGPRWSATEEISAMHFRRFHNACLQSGVKKARTRPQREFIPSPLVVDFQAQLKNLPTPFRFKKQEPCFLAWGAIRKKAATQFTPIDIENQKIRHFVRGP